jgi:hypothetical protein
MNWLANGSYITNTFDGLWTSVAVWLLVVFGLLPILRNGRWNWSVTRVSIVNIAFWIGWFFAVFFGCVLLYRTWFADAARIHFP